MRYVRSIESLSDIWRQIKNMIKNHHLAKAISDVSWYELTRQLEYKAKWNGRKYIKIDTFYASSQLCSVCGYQNYIGQGLPE